MEIHYKSSVWIQIKFHDKLPDREKLIRDLQTGLHPTEMDLPDAEWNVIYDTEEQLTPEENDGQATIEIMEYNANGQWLETTWSNEIKKDPYYELTSNYSLYYGGESILFNTGFKFRLAGFELSKHSNDSPFHYNDDIIRLPNSIVKKVEND